MALNPETQNTKREPAPPEQLKLRIEDAGRCDGRICGEGRMNPAGKWMRPQPHHHLVLTGPKPGDAPLYFAV